MELSSELLALFFLVGAVAGFIDAAAGGGGLITIPALLFSGMTPVQALATNKFQACFGSFSASWHFVRQQRVKPQHIKLMITAVALSSALGAYAVQLLSAQLLLMCMPIVLIAIALYCSVTRELGESATEALISHQKYSATAAPAVGFYDGFAGPGTGTFFALSLVKLRGMDYIGATAHAKVLNFTSNVCSLVVFAIGGQVLVLAALTMAAGQIIGARLGASAAIKHGGGFIRKITVLMSLAMSVGLMVKYW